MASDRHRCVEGGSVLLWRGGRAGAAPRLGSGERCQTLLSSGFSRVPQSVQFPLPHTHDLQEDPQTNSGDTGSTLVKYHSKNRERVLQNVCWHLVFEFQGSGAQLRGGMEANLK